MIRIEGENELSVSRRFSDQITQRVLKEMGPGTVTQRLQTALSLGPDTLRVLLKNAKAQIEIKVPDPIPSSLVADEI